uniref:Uncharacterized protein n=1 Tax=Panagrolaimus davidi TaxID=227884 RepID=A0A914PPB0_9BILA
MLWLTTGLSLSENDLPIFNSLIRPIFYRCEFYKLNLYECSIKYGEFKSLVLTVKEIYLAEIKMKYEDGNIVMLENILEAIPNIEDFY